MHPNRARDGEGWHTTEFRCKHKKVVENCNRELEENRPVVEIGNEKFGIN
jgi:hypothetical protein